jgi:ADP-ribose pyrophosphatase
VSGGFRAGDEQTIYSGALLTYAQREVTGPDGTTFTREVVHHPGAVSVVAVDDERRAVLVRQYRAAVDGELLEIPAGKRDVTDEPPEETARRELREEVGLEASDLELLACFYNSPGFCDEYSYVFLARGLISVESDLQGPEEQHLVVERIALDDVPDLIRDRELVDAKSIIGLTLALERLR